MQQPLNIKRHHEIQILLCILDDIYLEGTPHGQPSLTNPVVQMTADLLLVKKTNQAQGASWQAGGNEQGDSALRLFCT